MSFLDLFLLLLLCCIYIQNVGAFFRSGPFSVRTISSSSVVRKSETTTQIFSALDPIDDINDDVNTTATVAVAMATKPRATTIPSSSDSSPNSSPISLSSSTSIPTDWLSESNQLSYATVIGALLAGDAAGLVLQLTAHLPPELELLPSFTSALSAGFAIKYVSDSSSNELTPILKSYLGVPVLAAQRAVFASIQKKVDETVQEIISVPKNIKIAIVKKTDETVAEVWYDE